MKYIEESKAHDIYDDMLDECYPELFNMAPSYILRKLDPTAYRCGFNDFCDSQNITTDEDEAENQEEVTA